MPFDASLSMPFFNKFEDRFKISLLLHIPILLLGAITLDGGGLLRLMLVGVTAYWCAVGMIMVRRNGNATRGDRFLLTWGFPILLPVVASVATVVPMGALRHP